MQKGDVLDGTVTNEPSKMAVTTFITNNTNDNSYMSRFKYLRQKIWDLREKIGSAILTDGYCFKYDLSLPLTHFYEIVPATRERVGDHAIRVCGYGHVGDSNLHLNVSCSEYSPELHRLIEPFVYEFTSQLRGSVSAEHGLGFLKSKYLKYSKADQAVTQMRELKAIMDPNGILNPYKVLNN